jgi:hypothetical protein
MSNSLSIATVTACIRKILENSFISTTDEDELQSPKVTTLPPDDPGVPQTGQRGANIFLFQVTPNAHWRNTDLPTRSSDANLMAKPRLALDLHYLVTFYGDETALEAQRLLGIASRTLHEQPVLSRNLIEETIAAPPDGLEGIITRSNLNDAEELVRITPTPMTIDELTRIWSVLAFQTKFRLSLIYQASVVLIEREVAVREALPVKIRNVYVDPINPAVVTLVTSEPDPAVPIVNGSTIAITGNNLLGNTTRVAVDGDELTVPLTESTPTRIVLTLPTTGIRAGTHGLQVVLLRDMGTPPTPHRGSESNVFAFVLNPGLTANVTHTNDPPASPVSSFLSGTITMQVAPAVGREQRVALMLNQVVTGDTAAQAYVFAAPSRPSTDPPESPSVTVRFADVVAGTYYVRIRVDGATSELTATRQVVLP